MQAQISRIKPVISNVVATSSLNQSVDVKMLNKFDWGIYDMEIYGGKCGYIKTANMQGRVTIFPSGKMISVGARSIEKAKIKLHEAKLYLVKEKLISDTILKIKVQNIVATLSLKNKLNINKLFQRLDGAIYEPEQFPGIILRSARSVTYLIFSSGKIVISGAKSREDLFTASYEIQQKVC